MGLPKAKSKAETYLQDGPPNPLKMPKNVRKVLYNLMATTFVPQATWQQQIVKSNILLLAHLLQSHCIRSPNWFVSLEQIENECNITSKKRNPSCPANRILYNGWLQLCTLLLLPISYILTGSGFFQEFGAVSRTNVLRKSFYCAAVILALISLHEQSATADNIKETSCVKKKSWKVSGLKRLLKCAAWFAP